MNKKIVFCADLFPGSGYGHIRRSTVLAKALHERGYTTVFILDDRAIELAERFVLPDNVICKPDGVTYAEFALAQKAEAVVVDSYELGDAFETVITDAGRRLVVIDDHEVPRRADLVVNYKPGVLPRDFIRPGQAALLGDQFFLSDNKRLKPRVRKPGEPMSVVIHAGGNGDFSLLSAVAERLVVAADRHGWQLTWLCPHAQSQIWVQDRIPQNHQNMIGWQADATALWHGFDLVVGPASTSVYEAIMQGSAPLSFAVSPTQTDDRAPWVKIGHLLHLEHAETQDPAVLDSTFDLIDARLADLQSILARHSAGLDGRGPRRVAAAIDQLLNGQEIENCATSVSDEVAIRPCLAIDAHAFLIARNAPKVRMVSTDPNHIITWPEHVRWWLAGTTERFLVEKNCRPLAFFWHRAHQVDGTNYLVGGWFPASDAPLFTFVIQLLDWQLKHGDATHQGHTWIATINRDNKAVIALNQRFGYKEASAKTRDAAKKLFPGTDETFAILERAGQ